MKGAETVMQSAAAHEIPPSPETAARARLTSRFALFSQPLPTEAELFAMWGDSDEVVVSIACATFEHGVLLDDAIRSFLLQKTRFRFEIVIRDDASTDGTRDLIADYMRHYPRIIRARIYDENQFTLGRRPSDDWIGLTRGAYVAFCEGDDFWTDRDKLQDQVAQLQRHPDCVISVAGTFWYNLPDDQLQEKGIAAEESVHDGIPPQYHHTSTFVIERRALAHTKAKQKKYGIYGDTALRRLLVDHGKCICLPRLVSVYWVSGSGIWTSRSQDQRARDHVLIFAGLVRAAGYRNKPSHLRSLSDACVRYFPISLRNRDWGLAAACCVPFALRKVRNLSRRVRRKLGMGRET